MHATDAIYPSLRDAPVIVTGGASGIGAEIVRRLAAQGARVAFLDIAADAGRALVAEIAERVHECLALVGLPEKAQSYPAQLSGGQKQRVAIARALAPRPQVLLCDEPTSALDSETTRSLLETLRDINQKVGVTIVIVTHELSVVELLCRHVAILEQGRLVEQFAVDELGVERQTVLGRELAELVRTRPARDAARDTSRDASHVSLTPVPAKELAYA